MVVKVKRDIIVEAIFEVYIPDGMAGRPEHVFDSYLSKCEMELVEIDSAKWEFANPN